MIRVYLAGGMKTEWRDSVIDECPPDTDFYDPSEHGLSAPKAYTPVDMTAIEDSDLVFAYMEDGNPGGANMALEMGYALGLGKPVIYVDEKSASDPGWHRYSLMLHCASTYSTHNFLEGIEFLKEFLGAIRENLD